MSNLNASNPAGRERANTSGAERLAILDARRALRKRLDKAQEAIDSLNLEDEKDFDAACRIWASVGQQAAAFRERVRSSQEAHGEDPQAPKVAPC